MLKVKPFRQTPGLCGPACLKMVFEYYGVKKSEKELAKLSGATTTKGVEASGLAKAAKKLGFQCVVKDFCTLKDIRKYVTRKIPVIVDWFSVDDGHYSVVVGIDTKNIYMQDPELGGLRTMDLETFNRVWFDFPANFLKSKREILIRRLIVVLPVT